MSNEFTAIAVTAALAAMNYNVTNAIRAIKRAIGDMDDVEAARTFLKHLGITTKPAIAKQYPSRYPARAMKILRAAAEMPDADKAADDKPMPPPAKVTTKIAKKRHQLSIAPAATATPARDGSKQQSLIEFLFDGTTLSQLSGVTGWSIPVVRAALFTDVKGKGYGVRQDGTVFHLVLPQGMKTPLPPRPLKKEK